MKLLYAIIIFLTPALVHAQFDSFEPGGSGTSVWDENGNTIYPTAAPWDSTRLKFVPGSWAGMSYLQPYGTVGTQPDSAYGIKWWKYLGTRPIMNLNANTVIVGGDKTSNFSVSDVDALANHPHGGLIVRGQTPSASNEGATISLLSSYTNGGIKFYQTGPVGKGTYSTIYSGPVSGSGYRAAMTLNNYQRTIRLQDDGIALGRSHDIGWLLTTNATIRGGNVDVKGTLYADTIIAPLRVVDTTNYASLDSMEYQVQELITPSWEDISGDGMKRGAVKFQVNYNANAQSVARRFKVVTDTAQGFYILGIYAKVVSMYGDNYKTNAGMWEYFIYNNGLASTTAVVWVGDGRSLGDGARSTEIQIPETYDASKGQVTLEFTNSNYGHYTRCELVVDVYSTSGSATSEWYVKLANNE